MRVWVWGSRSVSVSTPRAQRNVHALSSVQRTNHRRQSSIVRQWINIKGLNFNSKEDEVQTNISFGPIERRRCQVGGWLVICRNVPRFYSFKGKQWLWRNGFVSLNGLAFDVVDGEVAWIRIDVECRLSDRGYFAMMEGSGREDLMEDGVMEG